MQALLDLRESRYAETYTNKKDGLIMDSEILIDEFRDAKAADVLFDKLVLMNNLRIIITEKMGNFSHFVMLNLLKRGLTEKQIIEDILYIECLEKRGIILTKNLINPQNKFSDNIVLYEGKSMEKKGSIVLQNPPYNKSKGEHSGMGNALAWTSHVEQRKAEVISGGYCLNVHPAGLRKPDNKLGREMFENQIDYMEVHNLADGHRTFRAGTRYDWYIWQNSIWKTKTEYRDEDGITHFIDLREWPFVPNCSFDLVKRIIDFDAVVDFNGSYNGRVIFSEHYKPGKNNVYLSDVETDVHKHKVIHTIYVGEKKEPKVYFSSTNELGDFCTKKVIVGENGNVMADFTGNLLLSQNAFAIPTKTNKDTEDLVKFFHSNEWNEIRRATSWSNFRVVWRMFKYCKPNFWREFI